MDEVMHAEMTQKVLRQKEIKEELKPLEIKLKEWLPRLEEVTKLFEQVKKKYDDIKAAVDKLNEAKSKLMTEYDTLEMEKDVLRKNARLAAAETPTADAQVLIEQFKQMGIDPADAQLKKEMQQADSESALAELKAKMEMNSPDSEESNES